jgi:hypothetical protein
MAPSHRTARGRKEADAFLALYFSTVAVEKTAAPAHIHRRERTSSLVKQRNCHMRIMEMAASGVVALAAQMLVVATVLI